MVRSLLIRAVLTLRPVSDLRPSVLSSAVAAGLNNLGSAFGLVPAKIARPAWASVLCAGRQYRFPPLVGEESGSILVFISLAFMVLVGFAALALDGSYAYLQQQRVQIAADAAALAGARQLALSQGEEHVNTEIRSLAAANEASSVNWGYTADGLGVQVTAERTFPTFFAGIIGRHSQTVRATATAKYGPVAGRGELMPMTISCSSVGAFQYGEIHTFWEQVSDAPGAFGWLDWDEGANSNMELADDILNPDNSTVLWVGDDVYGNPGVKSSNPVGAALETWRNRSVTIPLYGTVAESGSNVRYTVCGFARFTLLDYDFTGRHKWVSGRFEKAAIHGDIGAGNAPDLGAYTIVLTQ